MNNHMSLALITRPVISASAGDEGASPRFGRLARTDVSTAATVRPRIDVAPLPEVVEEQDPERWDGMA
jgi:hypothetical protein